MSGSRNYGPRGCSHSLTRTHKIYCLLMQHRSVFPLVWSDWLSCCEGVEALVEEFPRVMAVPLAGTVL